MTRYSQLLLALFSFGALGALHSAQATEPGHHATFSYSDDSKKKKGKVVEEAPAGYKGPKKRLAIMNKDLQGNTAPTGDWLKIVKERYGFKNGDDVGLKLNSMLTTALQETGRFIILERQDFDDIRAEQDLTQEGQTTEKTGAKKGGISGAQAMIRCTITEFVDDAVKEGGLGGIKIGGIVLGGRSNRKKAKVTVDIKMYEVGTSKIMATSSASGFSESKDNAGGVGGMGGALLFGKATNDPIEKATRDAIVNAVNFIISKMEDLPWEGKIALAEKDDDGKMVYVLNRGSSDGIKVGDELTVLRPGKVIIDEDTGESLGTSKGKVLGTCKVISTEIKTANVEPVGDTKIFKGNILRLK